jgi:predicted membrane protein
MNRDLRKTALGGLFVAMGVLVPIMFHAVGLGKTFLPMHIPVILSGFYCGPARAMLVGFVTPLLSGVMTGMPPLFPTAWFMAFELATYGLISSLLYEKARLGVIPSLLGAMFGGRIVYGLSAFLVFPFLGYDRVPIWAPLVAAFTESLPGVILQLVLIPVAVALSERDVRRVLGLHRD